MRARVRRCVRVCVCVDVLCDDLPRHEDEKAPFEAEAEIKNTKSNEMPQWNSKVDDDHRHIRAERENEKSEREREGEVRNERNRRLCCHSEKSEKSTNKKLTQHDESSLYFGRSTLFDGACTSRREMAVPVTLEWCSCALTMHVVSDNFQQILFAVRVCVASAIDFHRQSSQTSTPLSTIEIFGQI